MVYSFPWPIPLVPSLLWFLSILILCWPSAAFLELDSGFLFSWPIPATRAVTLQGACQHLFGEFILPPPLRPSFVGRHSWPDFSWYSVPSPTSKEHSPQDKSWFLLTNILGWTAGRVSTLGTKSYWRKIAFWLGKLIKRHWFPSRNVNSPLTLLHF